MSTRHRVINLLTVQGLNTEPALLAAAALIGIAEDEVLDVLENLQHVGMLISNGEFYVFLYS